MKNNSEKPAEKTIGNVRRGFGWGWQLSLAMAVGIIVTGCTSFNLQSANSKANSGLFGTDKDRSNKLLEKLLGNKNDKKTEALPAMGSKLRWDGGGVILGESDSPVFSAQSFAEIVQAFLSDNRHGSIKHLVRRYPDVSLKVLQEVSPDGQNKLAMQTIAANFDEIWCARSQPDGWQNYVVELSGDKGRELLEVRRKFWEHLKKHQPQQALDLNLVKSLPRQTSVMLTVEFYRLESIALMMNDDIESSIEKLKKSISLVSSTSRFQANQMNLLLGEFYRHSGQLELWKKTWQSAVDDHSELVQSEKLLDPSFWSKAAFLRPSGLEWPETTIANLKNYLDTFEFAADGDSIRETGSESIIWFTVGLQHLKREDGQNSILALKKAEAAANAPQLINLLQLYQARALVMSGQPGAASAILFRISSKNEGKLIADRAKAILGALKLQNGAIGQGINLLQSSIKTADQWPRDERLRAQADYSLALLVKGSETEGLAMLLQAQQEFEAIGDFEQAHQCLWNQAQYFQKTENTELQKQAVAKLNDFEKAIY